MCSGLSHISSNRSPHTLEGVFCKTDGHYQYDISFHWPVTSILTAQHTYEKASLKPFVSGIGLRLQSTRFAKSPISKYRHIRLGAIYSAQSQYYNKYSSPYFTGDGIWFPKMRESPLQKVIGYLWSALYTARSWTHTWSAEFGNSPGQDDSSLNLHDRLIKSCIPHRQAYEAVDSCDNPRLPP